MSKIVSYRRPYGKSARLLSRALNIRRSSLGCGQTVVTWGAGTMEGLNNQIRLGKLHQLQTWSAVPLSTLTYSLSHQQGWLARSGASFGGRDFRIDSNFRPTYWTKPLHSSAEYRLHLFRLPNGQRGNPAQYRVIRFGWKINVSPELNRIVEGVQIKSRQYGWRLKYYSQENLNNALPDDLDLLARWAIASIGWDFGAVDVMKVNGKYVLIEANSCPSLQDEATCRAYASAIKEHLDGE